MLKVHSIFKTFQGEGPYVGYPSIFIRLSGCNLACSFCDTEFDSYREKAISWILNAVEKLVHDKVNKQINLELHQEEQALNLDKVSGFKAEKRSLIVITGGEPFRQNIGPLCEALTANGYVIQIETNGTLYCPIPKEVKIVCSPKNTGAGYKAIREDILAHAVAIKFIVSEYDSKYRDIGEVGQSKFGIPVYIQPMDEYDIEKNRANSKLSLELAEKHGYRIGMQMHKVFAID